MLIIHRSISIPSESRDAIQVLDQCLDVVMGCMRANKLNLNPDKMERLCGLGYWVWKSVLLGSHFPGKGTSVALSSFIIWGHIWQWVPISSCSWFTSYGMYKKDKVMQLYPSNLPSGLLQCIVCGAFLEDGWKLQLEAECSWIHASVSGRSHAIPIMGELHWLPVCFHLRFAFGIWSLHNLGLTYLKDRLHFHNSSQLGAVFIGGGGSVRSCSSSGVQSVAEGVRPFFIKVPKICNFLPLDAHLNCTRFGSMLWCIFFA